MIRNRRPAARPSSRAVVAILGMFATAGVAWGASRIIISGVAVTPVPPESTPVVEGPITHDNLTVYVVRGPSTDGRAYVTLDEGLASGVVKIHEKGEETAEVDTLEIENRSDKWLFLQAGDVVKGGKQDRTITTDATLAPHGKPQPIAAFCVERGRWTPGSDGLAFRKNTGMVVGNALKRSIQGEKSQPRVWQEVAKLEAQAASAAHARGDAAAPRESLSSTGTYNAIAENRTLVTGRDPYVSALLPRLEPHRDALGLVVAINGRLVSADVYESSALFRRLAKKLLESYALEAVLARAEPSVTDVPALADVKAFLARPAAAQGTTETVGDAMHRATRETAETVMYEYAYVESPKGAQPRTTTVHKNYLKK